MSLPGLLALSKGPCKAGRWTGLPPPSAPNRRRNREGVERWQGESGPHEGPGALGGPSHQHQATGGCSWASGVGSNCLQRCCVAGRRGHRLEFKSPTPWGFPFRAPASGEGETTDKYSRGPEAGGPGPGAPTQKEGAACSGASCRSEALRGPARLDRAPQPSSGPNTTSLYTHRSSPEPSLEHRYEAWWALVWSSF